MSTVLNAPSVAELKDLVKATDYKMHQLAGTFVAFSPTWIAADINAENDWRADFEALEKRYIDARNDAQVAFNRWSPFDPDNTGAQLEWDGILKALKQIDGQITKSDFQDLNNRLENVMGKHVDYRNMPQPVVGSDYALNLFNKAGIIAKKIEHAVSSTGSALPWVAIGLGAVAAIVIARKL